MTPDVEYVNRCIRQFEQCDFAADDKEKAAARKAERRSDRLERVRVPAWCALWMGVVFTLVYYYISWAAGQTL